MSKKYQVFVSSTYTDLVEARKQVIEAILELQHFPVGMEMFGASDSEQWDYIKNTIDASDYYVVIIGHRYGSVADDGIGFTEKEYDYAKSKSIPVLAFIRDRNAATKPNERDNDPNQELKLAEFIAKAQKSKLCNYWTDDRDLVTKVTIDLTKQMGRTPGVGWIRADEAIPTKTVEELAVLSEENRKLRARVNELEAKLVTAEPCIELLINNNQPIRLKRPKYNPITDVTLPSPIQVENISKHLAPYVEYNEISNYNNSLPTQEVVNHYNQKSKLTWLVKNQSTLLPIMVCNSGNQKANDIRIDIVFPEEILVLKQKTANSLKAPKNPIPDSPLDEATRRYNMSINSPRRAGGLGSHLGVLKISNLTLPKSLPSLSELTPIPALLPDIELADRAESLKIERNSVKIRINSLLHTTEYTPLDSIVIIPKTTGAFTVTASIIYEEAREAITTTFQIQAILEDEEAP